MTVKMIGYLDPRKFYLCSGYEKEYSKAIHLCATKSLARAVTHLAKKDDAKEYLNPNNVVAALDFVKKMLGEWSSPECKLSQYARLSEIIRDKRQKGKDNDLDTLRSIRLNQYEVLQTMRLLTEINITPSSLQQHISGKEEQLFVSIWIEMEKRDSSFQEIRRKVNKIWNNKKKFRKEALEQFRHLTEHMNFSNQILLHGFYFITPIQHKIFTLLKESGFELIFINLYDDRYPSVFDPVKKFISKKYGWTDDWIVDKNTRLDHRLGQRFASSFEGIRTERDYEQNIKKKVYENFYEFLSEFDGEIKETIYLSPISNELNNRIKEYYPDKFRKERHLLSYPAGQFLFHLHKMWDEQKNTIVITEQSLMECFASRWLIDPETNRNAADYTKVLYELLPFFQSCVTAEDWKKHAEKLKNIKSRIVKPFEKRKPTGVKEDRFHKILENPYVWLSYLNVCEDDIEHVRRFIVHLVRIAEYLFGGDEKVSLNTHFKRLEKIVEIGLSGALDDEKIIIVNLLERLQRANNDEKFLVQDLSEAIALYLGGKLEDDPDDDNQDGKNRIFSFQDIDGKVIEASINKDKINKKIHVCGLDENNLPQSSTVIPWPLTRKTLEKFDENKSLYMILLREELKPQISRYLFYSFASFAENGVVSWIKNWDGKEDLEESFYLMLLDLPPEPFELQKQKDEVIDKEFVKETNHSIVRAFDHYPEEMLQEYMFCPRRFFYSFITQDHATYRNDFHHEFLFGNLIKGLPVILKCKKTVTSKEAQQLFPQWGELKKQYLTETNERYVGTIVNMSKRNYIYYGGIKYPFIQKQLQMLLHKGSKTILDKDNEGELGQKWDDIFGNAKGIREKFNEIVNDDHPMLTATPSYLCRFCPHNDRCPDVYYPVDDEQRKIQNN